MGQKRGGFGTAAGKLQTTFGTPKIYTTTGLGPRKNREMAGVDDVVVYMQTAVKYSSLYIHHPGGAHWYIDTSLRMLCREAFKTGGL